MHYNNIMLNLNHLKILLFSTLNTFLNKYMLLIDNAGKLNCGIPIGIVTEF